VSNYNIIKHAIQKKLQIIATFKGHKRELCPHVLGTKNGTAHCLFYQFGGSSGRGLSDDPNQNWRCIPVDELQDISVIEGKWYSWTNYNLDQSCVDKIDVTV
jgi:hypothetical protein